MRPPRTPFTAPRLLSRRVRDRAPSRTVSENWGRSFGYYGDEDVTTRGYESVVLYVRKGLGREEIIRPVIDFTFEVQQHVGKRWTLVPVSYGWGEELKHLGTDIPIPGSGWSSLAERVTADVCGMAGTDLEDAAVVRKLFPRTSVRNLYGGKTRVTGRDLLVFVDLEPGVVFDAVTRRAMPAFRRCLLSVTLPGELEQSRWVFGPQLLTEEDQAEEGSP